MDEIRVTEYHGTYDQYKNMVDVELAEAAAGFVRIGYLLKIARDTDILKESGYKDVNEFAKAEYGLSKDVVSRYIDINTRYSENGCSDRLQDRYRAYGYSKLAEMLTLPEAVAEEITPETTREEIREIKREIREEQEISDIEVMLEPEQEKPAVSLVLESVPEKVFYEVLKHFDTYHKVKNFFWNESAPDAMENKWILNTFAPAGRATISVRVPKTGKFMVTFDESKEDVVIINVRSMEKEYVGIAAVGAIIERLTEFDYYDTYPDEKKEPQKPINTSGEGTFGTEPEKTAQKTPQKPINTSSETDFETENDRPGKTEVAPAQPEENKNIVREQEKNKEPVSEDAPDDNAGSTQEILNGTVEKTRQTDISKINNTEELRAAVGWATNVTNKSGTEAAEYDGQDDAPQEAAGQDELERKEPEWYGFRWIDMMDAFEELNGFFRTYRKRDMESQIIPKARLKEIHDHAVNIAAAIERAIGAGYGK